ncbi:MAG: translocation/assembly module TamB domain-containing protein [Candidatus Solibacter usitatus]|nr:translocation/assembly module TamB domain-containing protein [Candidatus Solibacter usitatus]
MRRRWIWLAAAAGVVALAVGVVQVMESAWLREKIRARVVEEVERASGGRATLERFGFDWRQMRVSTGRFVLRGKEAGGRDPFLSAQSLEMGLTVRSWLGRDVHLSRLAVEKPEVHIYAAADGSTNVPEPKVRRKGGNLVEDLIALKIGNLEVKDGLFELDSRRTPFAMKAEGLDVRLAYDRAVRPRYRAWVAARAVQLPWGLAPAVEAEALLEADRVTVERLEARQGGSRVEASGVVANFRSVSIAAQYRASVQLGDIARSPVREGTGTAEGTLNYDERAGVRLEGRVSGRGLGYKGERMRVEDVSLKSEFRLDSKLLTLAGLSVEGPLGAWSGRGEMRDWRRFSLEGKATGLELDAIQKLFLEKPYPWGAGISGPCSFAGEVTSAGLKNGHAEALLDVAPEEGSAPLSGQLDLVWNQAAGEVDFGRSWLATDSARMSFRGRLGQRLEAGLFATRIRDVEPVVAMLLWRKSFELPVTLRDGEARIEAVVTGPLDHPEVRGRATARNLVYQEIPFDRIETGFHVTSQVLELTGVSLQQERARGTGELRLGLREWRADASSEIRAGLQVTQGDLAHVLRLAGSGAGATGTLGGTVEVSGTVGNAAGRAGVSLKNAAWGRERFKEVEAQVRLDSAGALQGFVAGDKTRLDLAGSWHHPPGDYGNGELKLAIESGGVMLEDVETIQQARPGLGGEMKAELRMDLSLERGQARLRRLDGTLDSREVRVGRQALGPFSATGSTAGEELSVRFSLGLGEGKAVGEAQVHLEGEYQAEGEVHVSNLALATVREIATGGTAEEEAWAVVGGISGGATWKAPLADLNKTEGTVTISQLRVQPRTALASGAKPEANERTLRNSGPLVFDLSQNTLRVRSARLAALDTDLALSGGYSAESKSPWNVGLAGAANLNILGSFYPDLIASGAARIDATVRGAASDPQLSGRMTVSNASFYLKDLPNGIEKASGTIFFDKNRANIEQIVGSTGGGTFKITGFIGFAPSELTYRLQAEASTIRVRYPEGVSTTLDASLNLTGSTGRSLLAGVITVRRSGFTANSDLANMVGGSGNPIPAAASQNDFLRNLQFDVRVRTAPDAVFQSSYTQDLQTEADLWLRGSPSKPILLGGIKANQGAVQFFGNRYNITRGEVLFYNTAVVQPQVDLDLETRVRGITVYINVGGPLSRLNVSYRSEPPLQSSEILALLTVGRTPASTSSSVATSDSIRSQTVMESNPNTLLGGAISAGLSSRAERLFGSSRIRIDPNFTGVENLPQARLSFEQPLSRDVTLTFITNLSRSQQQVVRIEWDLSRQWSAIAVKEENGAFALDFLFRRRFK